MSDQAERAIEAMALALCKWDDVDPDHVCYGMGVHVPKGESCTALELRKMTVRAILPSYEAALWSDDMDAAPIDRWVMLRGPAKCEVVGRRVVDDWLQAGVNGEFEMSWKPTEWKEIYTDIALPSTPKESE